MTREQKEATKPGFWLSRAVEDAVDLAQHEEAMEYTLSDLTYSLQRALNDGWTIKDLASVTLFSEQRIRNLLKRRIRNLPIET